ncbi:UNVERIFIED_CONTAM: hypothetical protein Sindi_2920000 [Sesamum indicum]
MRALTFYGSSSGATGGTSNLPGGVTLRTGGATPRAAYAREARRELHDVDNCGLPVVHISWPKFRRFRWIPARFRSLAAFVMSPAVGSQGRYTGVGVCGTVEKKQEAGRVGGAFRKKGCNTRTSQGVTHPSTTLAQARLTSEWDVESFGGVTLRTGGATPRAAYAREARRELHDVDSWACPVVPHFRGPNFAVSVDSGAFSIVGRIRDESGRGVSGGRYTGVGRVRGTVEKKQEAGRVGEEHFAKRGCKHEDFPGAAERQVGRRIFRGRNFAHWWSHAASSLYAREARRELHDVDNWACPLWPHFVAQISPFSVDSGAFSIVGRIRDESAVGLRGRYTGVGVCGTVEKKQEAGRVGGAFRKKGCNTRTSQGVTHPSTTLAQARLTSEF